MGKWEALTRLELLSDQYQLLVVTSLQYGPVANSLHYGVNIFPAITACTTKNYFNYFVLHEVGIHIMLPYTLGKIQTPVEAPRVYYIANENLARHINMRILDNKYPYDLGDDYYDASVFDRIYRDLDSQNIGDISSLYFAAVEQYKRSKLEL